MKRFLVLCLFISIFPILKAQILLSEEAEISILTSSPSEEAVFTVYGHTGVRVSDPVQKIDIVFNYGIFNIETPHFIYRFTKGETDYILGIQRFPGYMVEYELRGSRVTEQVLNLTQTEKQKIWNALEINAQPANRGYRYNFFFDNCSTRPVTIIENYVDGTIRYNEKGHSPKTFRDMINYSTRYRPWQTFGCDLALGSPTDRIITQHEEMFLPEYLMAAFEDAEIINPDGSTRPLIKLTTVLAEETEEKTTPSIFTPLLCCWILFLVIIVITIYEWKKNRYFRWLDFIIFVVAGLAGCILFFLAFISEHPCTCPNWLLIWLHPLHLAGAVLFVVKKWGKAAYCYHFINFAALTLMLLGWHFIPQHMNTAFFPLVGILWLRSGASVFRYKLKAE